MQVNKINNYDFTSFGRLNAAKKGAKYIMKQLSTQASINSDKLYAVYHGVAPKAEKTVNLPPVVQAMRRYLAADL